MNYLICEICGGYYHLMEGESLSDFDSCQCGGKLYLVEYGEESNIKSSNEEVVKIKSSKITCEVCGNLNNVNTPFCSKCGQILIPTKEIGAKHRNSSFKPLGVFAGLTFIVISIMVVGLFV